MNKRLKLNKLVKDNISHALLDLMQVKTFSDITVTDIVTKAGVARASYYRNYTSKEEIIREALYKIMQDFECVKHNDACKHLPHQKLTQLLEHVLSYKDVITTTFSSGLAGVFLNALTDFLQDTSTIPQPTPSNEWVVYAFSGALFNIINKWVQDDMRASPEEISDAFYHVWKLKHNGVF